MFVGNGGVCAKCTVLTISVESMRRGAFVTMGVYIIVLYANYVLSEGISSGHSLPHSMGVDTIVLYCTVG